ncbi:MAG: circularly permuted type 2 ATP-grasp protein [Pseudomonadota bacterium]
MATLNQNPRPTGMEAILHRYGQTDPARWDEAFLANGSLRPHWRPFFDWLERVGAEGYDRAASDLHRLRAESGIAFGAAEREVEADSLPVILSAEDWAVLEPGILQRARLAEATLSDVYGDATMIRQGVVPPGMAYASNGYAAHCAGWEPPLQNWLTVYEADIARAADGRWIVLADRLDTPLGDGWLIANRIATSEALADPFMQLGVRRVASHYAAFQDLLDDMTGWEGRLALMTGGEKDARFFSHAYFARYLNAALIEPADVTVRDGAAFVKTLDGLKKLDILLRGVSDQALDALHRPGDAARGAPALSLATRSGQLVSANAIGSSVLSYRGLAPYAHRLAPHLLDEDLRIDDAPCLWLGTPDARDQVLSEPDYWRIEPINRRTREAGLTLPEGPDALMTYLERNGERLAAVATPPLAQTPCWDDGQIVRSEWMMRVFASRTRDGWSLAPSGVASPVEPGRPPPDLDFGKDVWVLPSGDAAEATPARLADRFAGGHLRRTGRDLLSRVADEVFWLGRNMERAEGTLRVLNVCLQRYLSGNRADSAPGMLCDIAAIQTEAALGTPDITRFRDAIRGLLQGEHEPFGMAAILRALRSNAIRARSAVSEESWRYIDRLCTDRRWRNPPGLDRPAELSRLIADSLGTLAAVSGSAQENLTRNYAWRFLEIGRRLERAQTTARSAERLAGQARENEETYLRAWLRLSDSSSAYRSRYMMATVAPAVIDLLVLDESNPRALVFQIERLETVLTQLPTDSHYRRPEHRMALALLTEFRLADADSLAGASIGEDRAELARLTRRCREDLGRISTILSQTFFAHADIAEALVSQAGQKQP